MTPGIIYLQCSAACCGLVVGVWTDSLCLTISAAAIWLGAIYQVKNFD